jgi:hypothetical protein
MEPLATQSQASEGTILNGIDDVYLGPATSYHENIQFSAVSRSALNNPGAPLPTITLELSSEYGHQ